MPIRDLKNVLHSILEAVFKLTMLWMTLVGLGLVVLSVFEPFSSKWLSKVLEATGTAILAGGVFEAILKSLKYMDFFREALYDIVYDTKFLETRKDVQDVWMRVSKILYQSKFQDIGDRIQRKVLKEYFPINAKFYYDGLIQSKDILLHSTEDGYVVVAETNKFTIKAVQDSDEIVWFYESQIKKRAGDKITNYELSELRIDGKPASVEPSISGRETDGAPLAVNIALSLSGAKEYVIEMAHTTTLRFRVGQHPGLYG